MYFVFIKINESQSIILQFWEYCSPIFYPFAVIANAIDLTASNKWGLT